MSKTKAQLQSELDAATRANMDLRDEATGWHQRAKAWEDLIDGGVVVTADVERVIGQAFDEARATLATAASELEAEFDAMMRRNLWLAGSLAFIAGIVIGWVAAS